MSWLQLFLFNLNFRKRLADCGHDTWKKQEISVFGKKGEITTPVKSDGSVPYCAKCIADMCIKCACGNIISVGSPITLYPKNVKREYPEHTVFHENGCPVGCARCAEMSIADTSGYWIAPGRVKKDARATLGISYSWE